MKMRCDGCFSEFEQQPLGNWTPTCECLGVKRYWANVPPTAADRAAFHQLTGRPLPQQEIEGEDYWRYG